MCSYRWLAKCRAGFWFNTYRTRWQMNQRYPSPCLAVPGFEVGFTWPGGNPLAALFFVMPGLQCGWRRLNCAGKPESHSTWRGRQPPWTHTQQTRQLACPYFSPITCDFSDCYKGCFLCTRKHYRILLKDCIIHICCNYSTEKNLEIGNAAIGTPPGFRKWRLL